MTKCSIKRCGNDAVVRGLCRKHYMRLRRNGDATVTKTPGPKPRKADPIEELARTMVRDRSSRTLARCRRALTLLASLSPEIGDDCGDASKTDGAVNVSKLLRLVEDEVLRQVVKVHGLDSQIVHQSRAGYLSVVLKSIRARRRSQARDNRLHGGQVAAEQEPRQGPSSARPAHGSRWSFAATQHSTSRNHPSGTP